MNTDNMLMYKVDVVNHVIDMNFLAPFKDKTIEVIIVRHKSLRSSTSACPFIRVIQTDRFIKHYNDGLVRAEVEDKVEPGLYGRHEVDRHILHVPIQRGKAWVIVSIDDLDRPS